MKKFLLYLLFAFILSIIFVRKEINCCRYTAALQSYIKIGPIKVFKKEWEHEVTTWLREEIGADTNKRKYEEYLSYYPLLPAVAMPWGNYIALDGHYRSYKENPEFRELIKSHLQEIFEREDPLITDEDHERWKEKILSSNKALEEISGSSAPRNSSV